MNGNRWIAVALVGAFIVYLLYQLHSAKEDKISTTTSLGQRAPGTSVFFELINALGGTAKTQQSPYLEAIPQTNASEAIAVLSPSAPFTEREGRLFSLFVEKGGTLLLSLHAPQHEDSTKALFRELGISPRFSEDPQFKNRNPIAVKANHTNAFFQAGESYAFYGLLQLEDHCKSDPLACRFAEYSIGKGKVYLFASLPPFSNGLLAHADNRKLALRIAKIFPRMTFDEYHHYFSDRTFWDMMKRPAFGLTIAGIFIMLLLFFFFAHTPLHDKHLIPPPRKRTSTFHDFNEHFLQTAIKKPAHYRDNLSQYYIFLKSLFPEARERIIVQQRRHDAEISNQAITQVGFLREVSKIIGFHHHLLKRKGKITS